MIQSLPQPDTYMSNSRTRQQSPGRMPCWGCRCPGLLAPARPCTAGCAPRPPPHHTTERGETRAQAWRPHDLPCQQSQKATAKSLLAPAMRAWPSLTVSQAPLDCLTGPPMTKGATQKGRAQMASCPCIPCIRPYVLIPTGLLQQYVSPAVGCCNMDRKCQASGSPALFEEGFEVIEHSESHEYEMSQATSSNSNSMALTEAIEAPAIRFSNLAITVNNTSEAVAALDAVARAYGEDISVIRDVVLQWQHLQALPQPRHLPLLPLRGLSPCRCPCPCPCPCSCPCPFWYSTPGEPPSATNHQAVAACLLLVCDRQQAVPALLLGCLHTAGSAGSKCPLAASRLPPHLVNSMWVPSIVEQRGGVAVPHGHHPL
jgi:hypothetical protein